MPSGEIVNLRVLISDRIAAQRSFEALYNKYHEMINQKMSVGWIMKGIEQDVSLIKMLLDRRVALFPEDKVFLESLLERAQELRFMQTR